MKLTLQNALLQKVSVIARDSEESAAVPAITFRLNLPAPGLQGLSLFRIIFGLLVLCNFLFNQLPYFDVFYSDQGMVTRAVNWEMAWGSRFSILQYMDAPWQRTLFCAVYVLALICFIIGYRTVIAKWVVLVGLAALFYRNSMISYGFDVLIRLLMLWSLFVPLNRYWSVDSALNRSPRETPVAPVFLLAIEAQICMIYLFSGLFKLAGTPWLDGVAPGNAMRSGMHGTELGFAIVNDLPFLIAPLNYGTIAFQLLFPLLVFSPILNNVTRSIAILGAFAMHFSFIFLLKVGLFPAICLIYLVLLVPDRWISMLLAPRRARLERIALYFDPGCGFCEKTALLLRELCLSPFTRVLPASHDPEMLELLRRHNSWVVKDDRDGKIYLKWEAVSFVLRQNPLTWILGAASDLPFLKDTMRGVYEWIGRNRPALGKFTAAFLPFREIRPTPAIFRYVCGVMILLCFIGNVLSLPQVRINDSSTLWFRRAILALQIDQAWRLFAPDPVWGLSFYRMVGLHADGNFLEMTDFVDKSIIHRSENGYIDFRNHYWLKYYDALSITDYQAGSDLMLARLCDAYNRQHPEAPLSKISLYRYNKSREELATPGPLKPSFTRSLDYCQLNKHQPH